MKKWFTLYVGCDESNRGNRKNTKELIAAAFSTIDSDGEIIKKGKRCGYRTANLYLSPPGRGWNFTTRSGKVSQNRAQNLTRVLPSLVSHYLNGLPNKGEDILYISASLDGGIKKRLMNGLVGDFLNMGFWEAEVKSYIKKKNNGGGRISKGYFSPSLIWLADGLSSGLFRMYKKGLELENHRKYIEPLVDI